MTAKRLTNSAHVQEGRGRHKRADPVSDLFETADEKKARQELHRKLQFFPTQPWAPRALCHVLRAHNGGVLPFSLVYEPCAGRGHLVVPLREEGLVVRAFDIHDFGKGYQIRDFLGDYYIDGDLYDAVIMNPPFSDKVTKRGEPGLAERFVRRALDVAPDVFVLARLGFLKCFGQRYDLHTRYLSEIYLNTDRCDMVLGRYDPKADTATDSAWYRFRRDKPAGQPILTHFIPPGLKALYTKPEDVKI